jgi:predicted nucleic acid-binding protein
MKEYFIDTSYLVALANTDDRYHQQSMESFSQFVGDENARFWISDYIVDEFLTLVARRLGMKESIEWGEHLFQERWFNLVFLSSSVIKEAWEIYQHEKEEHHPLSFTNCTIIAHCKLMKIEEILTFDDRLVRYLK